MPAKKNPMTEAERSRRFVETARKLEADETGEKFERVFKKIVPSRPPRPSVKKNPQERR